MGMDVSVIISTYNRAGLLVRAIQSVYAQTLLPREVIVVDDGSTDGTEDVIRTQFPEVRYYYQSNRGVSAARNRGLGEAQGAWIALLDSDDEWRPKKLARQGQALREAPDYRVCHSDEIWIRRGRRVNPMKKHAKLGGYIFQGCLPMCIVSPSAAVIHRCIFEEVGFFDEALPACEDYDLWLRVCARYPVLLVNEPLIIKHGGRDDQLSQRYWGMDRFRIYALEKIVASGVLSEEDRWAVARVLVEKAEIYAQGAEKRKKWCEAAQYREKSARYSIR